MSKDLRGAQAKLNSKVMGRPGVAGTAIGEKGGKPCLKVYLSDDSARSKVPKKVGGVPVVVEKTGGFTRL